MAEVTAKAARTNRKVGRTASKEIRRQQLIDATIESISKFGISGTTMTTVTGFAGLSLGIVNFHFKNKQTLLEDTLRFLAKEHRDQWRRAMKAAGPDAAAQLLAIAEAQFHPSLYNRKKLAVWFAFYGEAAYRDSYRKIMSEMDAERWEISSGLCARIIEEGGYDVGQPGEIASTLEGLYDGFCLNILLYPGEFTRHDAKQRILGYFATTFPDHVDFPVQPDQEARAGP